MTPDELDAVVARLLTESEDTRAIHIDRIGEVIGLAAAGADEIERVLARLEESDRTVVAPEGGDGERKLARVIETARVLRTKLGRTPRPSEIAAESGLSENDVRHALGLASVIGR